MYQTISSYWICIWKRKNVSAFVFPTIILLLAFIIAILLLSI
ncbi:unnamed protein product [Onchocerca flexuosa]|uniref:Uncharacterized protein n=1 Tax=Onchocerca flexuosa TaxID=387005 RepID=A0A183I7J9_9BILA|nr:unnamed protein product [Onchocerca flexuosa]